MKTSRRDTIKKKKSKNGKYYFVRIAPNGEQVFRSQLYKYRQGCNKAINRILEKEPVKVISRSGELLS